MKILAALRVGLLSLLVGCSSSSPRGDAEDYSPELRQAKLGQGIRALDEGRYEAAHVFFSDFTEKNPISQFTMAALFYDAVSLNELGQFQEATLKLETVLKFAEGKDFYLEAETLYQLGKSYEGLGDDTKALVTLMDSEKRSKYLPEQIAMVEAPARIAGIYARLNQPNLADKYYNKAEDGLAKLKGKASLEKQDWIPRALYGMGKISPAQITEADFDNGLKSLRRSQSYLLRAIEFNHASWSARAEEELEYIYQSAWKVIETYPLSEDSDKLVALKQQQSRMIDLALVLNSVLSQLQQEFLPEQEEVNPQVSKLKSFVEDYDRKIDALTATRPVNEGLTPEAEKLEGLVREGKVVDSTGTLEKNQKVLPTQIPAKKVKKP